MSEKSTNLDIRKQPGWNPNPTGKGGFQERPQDISPGGWDKNNSFSYWLNYFKTLKIDEFKAYKQEHPDMTMAALAAYARAGKMIEDLPEFREVADRTEGKAKQNFDITTDGEKINAISIEIIEKTNEAEAQRDECTEEKPKIS